MYTAYARHVKKHIGYTMKKNMKNNVASVWFRYFERFIKKNALHPRDVYLNVFFTAVFGGVRLIEA